MLAALLSFSSPETARQISEIWRCSKYPKCVYARGLSNYLIKQTMPTVLTLHSKSFYLTFPSGGGEACDARGDKQDHGIYIRW